MIAIYKLVFPNWDVIQKIEGWPQVNANTWKYICRKFIDSTTSATQV